MYTINRHTVHEFEFLYFPSFSLNHEWHRQIAHIEECTQKDHRWTSVKYNLMLVFSLGNIFLDLAYRFRNSLLILNLKYS